ncbi:phosphoenolpyruvate--protein phosphotransferase [Mycobacterium sp. MS1601]|uniref:phosphoenolpyruvate--protein phosphotransferase n=1 Tax=Mycobacterium sp. MS1601 TaxID=1936029 RepID=UPI0009794156|nr:phosphoenolpyruvate--protein phosphotransferase [Mycobacterium sp. MS1601]AQA01618.1 phosphoenolpyruvate--protein phosphotransferase [Mycobacterium sp. MS1601]
MFTSSAISTGSELSTLGGIPVVGGVVFAPVIRPASPLTLDEARPHSEVATTDREGEAQRFTAAADAVAAELRRRAAQACGPAAEVLAANAQLAQDRAWLTAATNLIAAGTPAVVATVEAVEQFVGLFTEMGGLMAERVTDLRDIRDRVIAELLGLQGPGIPVPTIPSILCAEDLSPADTAGLNPQLIVGIATELGGPTSHTAIIARQLGIPCVVAVEGLSEIRTDDMVLLDGLHGTVSVSPDERLARAAVEVAARAAMATTTWTGVGATADGHTVSVLANVQDGEGARSAARTGAEGIGLFRTELCFLGRATEPSIEEQTRIYAEVLEEFPRSKVVIRTLDAGSDKPLQFAGPRGEANPALGVRGYRIAADNPGLIDRQLQAIAAAATLRRTTPWVMAPMIATAAEAEEFAELARSYGLRPGVMVEVPAAALSASRILEHVDFLSIGTNDLSQYTMAADRMATKLAALNSPWQPAMLTLVGAVANAGVTAAKPVGVCGEAAADPLLACVLAGLGVTSLSVASSAVTAVGAKLASVRMDQCREAARAVLAAPDAAQARAAALAALG